MKKAFYRCAMMIMPVIAAVMMFCGCDQEKRQNEELAKTLEKICIGGGMPGTKVLKVTKTGGKRGDKLHYKAEISYEGNTAKIDFYTRKMGDKIEVSTAYPQLLHLVGKICSEAAGRELRCILVNNITAAGGKLYTGKATVVDKDTKHLLNVEYKEDESWVEVKVPDAVKLAPASGWGY